VTQVAGKTGDVASDVSQAADLLESEASKLKTQVNEFITRVKQPDTARPVSYLARVRLHGGV
jgi:hypothetical protein